MRTLSFRECGCAVSLVWVIGCSPPPSASRDSQDISFIENTSDKLSETVFRSRGNDKLGVRRVVALGDSLTAGLGISSDETYPSLLQERLDDAGFELEVVNAGVSGDTSAGGLRRLDWSLDGEVVILIVALGGNDGLRGLPVNQLNENLGAIITTAQARNIEVILAGMEAPPNFGTTYTESFRTTYTDLSEKYNVFLVPFLLEGVAGMPELNQADGIHPNASGAQEIANHLWPVVENVARLVNSRPHHD